MLLNATGDLKQVASVVPGHRGQRRLFRAPIASGIRTKSKGNIPSSISELARPELRLHPPPEGPGPRAGVGETPVAVTLRSAARGVGVTERAWVGTEVTPAAGVATGTRVGVAMGRGVATGEIVGIGFGAGVDV